MRLMTWRASSISPFLQETLESSENALESKMGELEMQKHASVASAAKRKVASMAKFIASEMRADKNVAEADRKLSGKDAEIKLLLGNLKQLTDGLGQGASTRPLLTAT